MHDWSQTDVDWAGINAAAEYIGRNLIRWGRVPVSEIKEKYGSCRIYCGFGWYNFHTIFWPNYAYCRYKWKWLWHLDCATTVHKLFSILNYIIIPIHKRMYRYYYKQALKKWPHLWEEILCCADWQELLEGLEPRFDALKLKFEEDSHEQD
jgi:hypothetical protein